MDDLTITRLCAEAMGCSFADSTSNPDHEAHEHFVAQLHGRAYDPLHDDAQTMALVKKFKLKIAYGFRVKDEIAGPEEWRVSPNFSGPYTWNADLNSAICKCVAKLKQGEG